MQKQLLSCLARKLEECIAVCDQIAQHAVKGAQEARSDLPLPPNLGGVPSAGEQRQAATQWLADAQNISSLFGSDVAFARRIFDIQDQLHSTLERVETEIAGLSDL